jgi:uncharacterized protein (TIGR02145 family)
MTQSSQTMKKIRSFTVIICIGYLFALVFSCTKESSTAVNTDPVSVKDFDGNIYKTIKICDQTWTQTNLNVTHYRNGDPIPEVTNPTQWVGLTTGAWCYYNNDPATGSIYGKLYNGYAVSDPRGLAPQGSHIPSYTELLNMVTCQGGESMAGGKLKETGITHWLNPNNAATNSSSFTALPGGYRCSCSSAAFYNIGNQALLWSSTDINASTAWSLSLGYDSGNSTIAGNDKRKGFSIRFIKD